MRIVLVNNATFSADSILDELRRHVGLDHVHLLDHLGGVRREGLETTCYDLSDLQVGGYLGVDWSRVPPLDEGLIRTMADCEIICLPMLEKNGKIGKLLDAEARRKSAGIPHVRPLTTFVSYEDRRRLYLKHLQYWSHVLRDQKVDFVLITIAPHHGYDYVIYRLCKQFGIPVQFYDSLPVDGWILAKRDLEEADGRVAAAVAKTYEEYADGRHVLLSERAERFYNEQNNPKPTPSYMSPSKIDSWEYAPVRLDRRTLVSFARTLAGNLAGLLGVERFKGRGEERLLPWRVRFRKQRELSGLFAYYDSLAVKPDLGQPFVYLPLHYQPEISTSPLGGVFADQYLVAQLVAAELPKGWKLYVKEHPFQKSLARDSTFYADLARLPNTSLVPRDSDTYDLINRCATVATVTGRAGWEALFRGKPVLVFGETALAYAKGAFRIRNRGDCVAALSLRSSRPQAEVLRDMRIFLKAIEMVAIRGEIVAGSPQAILETSGLTPEEVGHHIAHDVLKRMEEHGLHAPKRSMKDRDAARFRSAESDALLVERPPMPRNMMVELTNACNHACIFCANPHMKRKVGRIDEKLLYRVMSEARANGVEEIGFYTTGDPFVHKDLAKFTKQAKDLGFRYAYISTNGALATPARMKAVIDAGIDSIKFSINAGSRETYKVIHGADDWDKVMEHLRFAVEYRKTLKRPLSLFVTYVVTKQTEHEVEAFDEAIGPLVDEVYFSPCTNQISQMDAAMALLSNVGVAQPQAQNTAVCKLPFNRLHVTREGYLTLCCVDYQNYLAIADLKKTSLMEAWHSQAFAEQRRRHLEGRLQGTLCGNCWLGRHDAIEPLDPKLADIIDFERFQVDQERDVRARIIPIEKAQ